MIYSQNIVFLIVYSLKQIVKNCFYFIQYGMGKYNAASELKGYV